MPHSPEYREIVPEREYQAGTFKRARGPCRPRPHGDADIHGETQTRLADYVREMVTPGLPGLRHLSGRGLRAQLDGYLRRIVDKDFVEQGHSVRNVDGLMRWMRAYAAATATTTSFEKIRDAASGGEDQKPAKTTIQQYREILEQLWILDPVPAWLPTRNKLSSLSKPPKHHLADPAFAVRLLGLDESAFGFELKSNPETGPGALPGYLRTVQAKYEDYWYWIEDSDMASKRVFNFDWFTVIFYKLDLPLK